MSKFVDDESFSFDDVLIVPQYSNILSRSEVSLRQRYAIKDMSLDIPIISANMDTVTGLPMAKRMNRLGGLGVVHRYMSEEESVDTVNVWRSSHEEPIFMSVGCLNKDKGRIDMLLEDPKQLGLCIDIAHGDSRNMILTLEYLRQERGFEGLIIAGNVCTSTGTLRLLQHGADIVKVGIGPGSACTTRLKTGCGYPQLSAIYNCAQEGPIIADGGIRGPADAAKALGAGAKAIMVGGLLAGSDATPGWSKLNTMAEFRGMASSAARKDFNGETSNAEGIGTMVESLSEGSTERTVNWLLEGIKSSMSYVGASTLDEFVQKTKFVKVSSSVCEENRPHILVSS